MLEDKYFDESNERPVDIEYVSEDVPGNMRFYR